MQIDRRGDIQHKRVETGDAEQLLDQPVHSRDLFSERRQLTVSFERIKPRCDDGQRRSQFVSGIGGEPALNHKALLQPVERLIDRDDEWERLGWHIGLGQAQRDRSGPDSARLRRYLRNGNSPLRTLKAASSKASPTKGGTYQAMSKTNSRRIEWTSWLPPDTSATSTDSGPAALSSRMLTPE